MSRTTPAGRARKMASAIALFAVPLTLLAACGGTSSSAKTTGGSSAAASSSNSGDYDAALAALVPASIRSKGTITVAANATYPPDEYIASDNTTIVGFDPDLAAQVGKILGLKFQFVNTPFATIIPGLQAGRYDIGWSSATATAARQQQVNFVTYFQGGIGFIVPADSTLNINGLADLCGLTVSVESGSLEQKTAAAQSTACVQQGKKAIALQVYQDENQNLLALSSGRAQVSLGGSQILPYLVQQSGGKFKVVGTAYNMGTDGVEIPKATPIGLAKAIQGALNKMIANGQYQAIMSKWHEQAGMVATSGILPASAAS